MQKITFHFLLSIPVLCVGPSAAKAFEHPRYDITATVDTTDKEVTAQQTVRFTNNSQQDVQELYFHVYPNRYYTAEEKAFMTRYGGYFKTDPFPDGFHHSGMDVRNVTHDGRPLVVTTEGEDHTLLKVILNETLRPGETVAVQMDFKLTLPHTFGRFGWHDNIIKLSRWYPILAVHNEEGWNTAPFYPFHRPFFSEAAHYEIALTVPKDQVVIHSADKVSEQETGVLKKSLNIKTSLPIREFTLAMSPDYQVISEEMDGVTLNSFYLAGDQQRAREALQITKDLMAFNTRRFGKYPYRAFSIAPVHLGYGGEQMSNLIFIDTRVYKLPGFLKRHFDFLIAHEAGHQWFYNLVGIDEYREMWLEEGVHSYFILEYLEAKYGYNASVLEYPDWFKDWEWMLPDLTFRKARDTRYKSIARIGYDRPVVGDLSSFQEPSSIFSLTYGKGSRILEMLHSFIGEEAFSRIFARIFKEYRFRNLKVKDFIRLCEEESGQDLDWFFDPWLKSGKYFDYAVNSVKNNVITLENRGGIVMPAEVKVYFKDGREQTLTWDPRQGQGNTLMVDDSVPIEQVMVDPAETLLDIDRTNNSWPRIVAFKPVPLYLGLYDIPAFMQEDAYNLIVGPELANSGIGVKAALHKPYDQTLYAGTDYEIGEDLHHSRAGYVLHNVLNTQTALGFQIANRTDLDGGEEDLVSGKVFLRRELWPAQYGLADINDHVTLYMVRNQSLNDNNVTVTGREDDRNIDYSRREEAIVGTSLHLNRSGPYPDPKQGYQLDTFVENAGHFLNATQFFYRGGLDLAFYQPVTKKSTLALRLKYAWGYPNDKELFFLGGIDGLRGFKRKSIRGANAGLGSVEYRFPIVENMKLYALDNILGLDAIGGVVFFDGGQAWFDDIDDTSFKTDVGFGLRFKVDLGAFLEKVIVRADVGFAIDAEEEDDAQFWLGVNHAF